MVHWRSVFLELTVTARDLPSFSWSVATGLGAAAFPSISPTGSFPCQPVSLHVPARLLVSVGEYGTHQEYPRNHQRCSQLSIHLALQKLSCEGTSHLVTGTRGYFVVPPPGGDVG